MQIQIKDDEGKIVWAFYQDACQIVDVQPMDSGCKVDILMGKTSKTILLEIELNSLLEQLPTENLQPTT